ncbi:MAG: hypothetical protein RLZZ23_1325 [Verrucomicrobiota bacterium]
MVRHLFQRLLGIRGLVVSLFIHLMLMMVAIVWVTSSITEKNPKQPEFIATGSGGGASGERAKILEHNLQLKKQKALTKKVSRISSKNLNAQVVLPDMKSNALSIDSMASKLSGSSSKGFGGGSGGGLGATKGVGVGNMRNFVGKPVMGARIVATKVAVFMDASKSMGRYLDRVESEIRKQFPTADVFMYAGVWTNVKDDVIIGGSRYKGTTGRSGSPPVKFTDPDKLTANGKRIFKQYDDNFKTGCVGAWIDIMRNERAYDGLVIFSDFQDGVTQYRSTKGAKPDSYSTQDTTIIYCDSVRSRLPTDDRKPTEKRWEDELVSAFAAAKSGRGPKLYLFSTEIEPQPIFARCVAASGGQSKMVEWLRSGGNPPPDADELTIGKPTVVKGPPGDLTPAGVRAQR